MHNLSNTTRPKFCRLLALIFALILYLYIFFSIFHTKDLSFSLYVNIYFPTHTPFFYSSSSAWPRHAPLLKVNLNCALSIRQGTNLKRPTIWHVHHAHLSIQVCITKARCVHCTHIIQNIQTTFTLFFYFKFFTIHYVVTYCTFRATSTCNFFSFKLSSFFLFSLESTKIKGFLCKDSFIFFLFIIFFFHYTNVYFYSFLIKLH